MRYSWSAVVVAAMLAACVFPRAAGADPDSLITCTIALVKASSLTRFVCHGIFALPSAGAAPGLLDIAVNPDPPGLSGGLPLPIPNCVGLGTPAGSKGYRCVSTNRIALLRPTVVKAVVRLDVPQLQYGTTLPYASNDLRIVLRTTGPSASKRYCAVFTAPLKNDAGLYRSKAAPPPAACSPSGAFVSPDGVLF